LLATEFIDTGTVQLTFHDFAFLGAESRRAAEAAECAADQNHFWEFHDLLFLRQGNENSGAFSDDRLKQVARELQPVHVEFDADGFDACLDSGRKAAVVDQSTASAANAGITQAPSFVINGKLLTGAQGIDVFRRAIQQALEAAGAGS
ncbi:MAG: thioredoxin domain-containing protein, partial [Chloroflexi bacterium]|nr:thioredoxin domain-containing protein [Chloroflexota bacterium]